MLSLYEEPVIEARVFDVVAHTAYETRKQLSGAQIFNDDGLS